jgi:hypothetical protein
MEIKIEEIYARADIKQIRKFLLDSKVIDECCYGTYENRLYRDSEDVIYALKRLCKSDEKEELGEVMGDLDAALSAYRDVYTEIGMRIGARLLFQLLCEDE